MGTLRGENVCWFDITMNNPLGVGGIECIGNFDSQRKQALGFEWLARNHVLKGDPLEIFHNNECTSIFFADVVDRAYIRVVQSRGGLCFTFKARQGHRIVRQFGREKLECD